MSCCSYGFHCFNPVMYGNMTTGNRYESALIKAEDKSCLYEFIHLINRICWFELKQNDSNSFT